jgi:D-sedoheptulose 7-phosphate isomerase
VGILADSYLFVFAGFSGLATRAGNVRPAPRHRPGPAGPGSRQLRGERADQGRDPRDRGGPRRRRETFRGGGRALVFGNGGSASDAQHLASELAGRFDRERPALPALALTANSSDLTAIGNDYGFEHVFARLVQAHGRPGDVAIALSTSGRSRNVNAAVSEARSRGLRSIALVGKGGGELASLVDVAVVVPSDSTARIQECHITLAHVLCELVDAALFPETGAS